MNICSKSRSVHGRKYRNFLEIVALILELAKNTFVSRFFLIKNIGTNSRHIEKYLRILVQRGLLRINYKNGRILYKTDEKGFTFLRHYEFLREMLFGESYKGYPVGLTETFLMPKRERSAR